MARIIHKPEAQAKEGRAAYAASLALRACLLILLATAAGCQFPAIDQSGQRIFSGGSTSLATHDYGGLFHHRQPPPAAAVPAVPPIIVGPVVAPAAQRPCAQLPPQPVVAVPAVPVIPIQPVACGPKGIIQQTPLPPKIQVTDPACKDGNCTASGPVLQVTPSRIVAPTGSEVVLVAGITDGRGYYVLRQPLEWMLAPDGVGHVMAVGKESPLGLNYVLRHSPQKVDTDYVRAHTSTIDQTIDRGTPNPSDDVHLEKGQSFITVTSPTEGLSHVTVWAPKEHNWERRQATATVYWVDARWQLPPSTSARAGQKQVLETVITRSGGDPVAGWIVRYEVAEGPEAVLDARGSTALEVRTDGAGRAAVELLPRTQQAGITTVRIQVIRPANRDVPQMVVGQGQTAVSWSTPGLSVTALGPSTVAADGTVSYRIEVANSGDLPARGVTLSYTPPTGVTVLNSTPAGQAFGQRYQWSIGDLPARTASAIELNCRASVAADIRSSFKAESADRLSAEASATTRVFANALSVRMTGPDAVEVGREAKFLVDISNAGSGMLTGLVASDTFDPGLLHTGGEASPLRKAIAQPLGPGETAKIALSFTVTRPGRHSHRLDVTADGGHSAGARSVVTGTQATTAPATAPELSVKVTGPQSQRAGEIAEYLLEVTNSGVAAATNVLIGVRYGTNLKLDAATKGYTEDPRRSSLQWSVAQLAGGETIKRRVNCRCLNPDERGTGVGVSVTSDQNRLAPVASATSTVITPAAPPVGSTGQPPVDPPPAGKLVVTIRDLADPIMVGGQTTYIIEIKNDRKAADRDVTLKLELPAGLEFTKSGGPTGMLARAQDGRSVDMKPIAEARPDETLPAYQFVITGTAPGKFKVRATVTSFGSPAGVIAEAETTVNAP